MVSGIMMDGTGPNGGSTLVLKVYMKCIYFTLNILSCVCILFLSGVATLQVVPAVLFTFNTGTSGTPLRAGSWILVPRPPQLRYKISVFNAFNFSQLCYNHPATVYSTWFKISQLETFIHQQKQCPEAMKLDTDTRLFK